MPSREYYLDKSEKMADMRAKYAAHIKNVLTLAKVPNADEAAAKIVGLETQIATDQASRVESEDVKGDGIVAAWIARPRASGLTRVHVPVLV